MTARALMGKNMTSSDNNKSMNSVLKIPGMKGVYRWVTKRIIWRAKFWLQYIKFKKLSSVEDGRFDIPLSAVRKRMGDATAQTGYDRHYILHTAWAARTLARLLPERHVDISSSLFFVSMVSGFIDMDFYDYRPADINISGLKVGHADLSNLNFADGSIKSLSCMHVVEHIGLARYGDPLDPKGDMKAISELKRVLAPGGNLLFVVPVGKPMVAFNAHRIYSFEQVVEFFSGLKLLEFALIPDNATDGDLVIGASPELSDRQVFGCGCFLFTKEQTKQ